jgi:hypothetical protein
MDPFWSETCWSTFKYFIILIVRTHYILCISWIIKCLIHKENVKEQADSINTPVTIITVLLWDKTSLSQDDSTNLTSDTASHLRRKQSLWYKVFIVLTTDRPASSIPIVRELGDCRKTINHRHTIRFQRPPNKTQIKSKLHQNKNK